jgi:hypothetical protein
MITRPTRARAAKDDAPTYCSAVTFHLSVNVAMGRPFELPSSKRSRLLRNRNGLTTEQPFLNDEKSCFHASAADIRRLTQQQRDRFNSFGLSEGFVRTGGKR